MYGARFAPGSVYTGPGNPLVVQGSYNLPFSGGAFESWCSLNGLQPHTLLQPSLAGSWGSDQSCFPPVEALEEGSSGNPA